MPSATEAAIAALVAALTAKANASPAPFPAPTRNNTLPARMTASVAAYPDVVAFFNVLDGEGRIHQETLGAPDVVANTYEIHQRVRVEWVVQSTNDADREAAFDAGLLAINASLAVDRTLGGAVNWCEIEETNRSDLVSDGLPNAKAVEVFVRLEFLSSLPF
jgi:hypothetical protein